MTRRRTDQLSEIANETVDRLARRLDPQLDIRAWADLREAHFTAATNVLHRNLVLVLHDHLDQ